jgi:hypothetical protein
MTTKRTDREFWIVMPFHNPARYSGKLPRFLRAAEAIQRQGYRVAAIEAVEPGREPEVPPDAANEVFQVSFPSVLWAKENLINIAVERLPRECSRVAWVDADVLFQNDRWGEEANEALKATCFVVQPFRSAVWLSQDVSEALLQHDSPRVSAEKHCVGAAVAAHALPDSSCVRGHVGFAWCARREFFQEVGLYDRMIIGGGDHIAACGFFGLSRDRILEDLHNPLQEADIRSWIERAHDMVQGRVGSVAGTIQHLWHGERKHREYDTRYQVLAEAHFDPRRDLQTTQEGVLYLSSSCADLESQILRYFQDRREDGA